MENKTDSDSISEFTAIWDDLIEIADKEISDDDPRLEPGYHQYGLDERTKGLIRAKYMKKSRKDLALIVSVFKGCWELRE